MINLGQINKIFLPQLWPQFHLEKMRWPQFLEKEFLNQVLGLIVGALPPGTPPIGASGAASDILYFTYLLIS